MDIERIDYHLEFYTGGLVQVEHYHLRGLSCFLVPRPGERVHLHRGSLTLDVTQVVHEIADHDDARLTHVVKVFGNEVLSAE